MQRCMMSQRTVSSNFLGNALSLMTASDFCLTNGTTTDVTSLNASFQRLKRLLFLVMSNSVYRFRASKHKDSQFLNLLGSSASFQESSTIAVFTSLIPRRENHSASFNWASVASVCAFMNHL